MKMTTQMMQMKAPRKKVKRSKTKVECQLRKGRVLQKEGQWSQRVLRCHRILRMSLQLPSPSRHDWNL